MRKILFIAICLLAGHAPSLQAQGSIDRVLQAVEQNNTTLHALQQEGVATKAGLRTDLVLPDPEIDFAYQWGKPATIGTRKNFDIRQGLDIATLSGIRSRAANEQGILIDRQLRADRMDVLLEAKLLCLDVIYYNALLGELQLRCNNARAIAALEERRLETGHGNRLELNNVKLDLAAVEGDIQRAEVEREAARRALLRLGAGEAVEQLTDTIFPSVQLPGDFASWYNEAAGTSPILAVSQQQMAVQREQLKVTKADRWPKLSVGFTSEYLIGERFQGISVGLSIPLWGNKRKMTQARANIAAAEARHADISAQYEGRLRELFHLQAGLKQTADTYAALLAQTDNTPLLKRALDLGSITVMDYLLGVRLYYDARDKHLAAQRDWQKAVAELTAMRL